ncbi:MAG: zinc-binding dehydrogenase [Chloroflexota bacterium]|nr:zinc-binding dehydrogenase [Chloroflexota bacterium]
MSEIKAVVVDPNAEGGLAIQSVATPNPLSSEALVKVSAFSLNLGEVRRALTLAPAGWQPGWDLAGEVIQPAADGSGPKAGTRVVGFVAEKAWAELVAVPTVALAPLPENVSFAQAATLPVAGLTALYALEKGGSLLGRRILVTGASGGVGLYGIQLAKLAGANVVAAIRQAKHEALVREAGATQVVIGEDLSPAKEWGPYHLILESVGGSYFSVATSLIAAGGALVIFGATGGAEIQLDLRTFYASAGSIIGFLLFTELGAKPASQGLARLVNLVSTDLLRPYIEVETDWSEIAKVANNLFNRQISRKAVLHIG